MGSQGAAVDAARGMIEGIQNLPTPPLVFKLIFNVAHDPGASVDDVASILSEDPAMTAKILKITNSAYYGLSGKVTSVKQAIVMIGMDGVKSLVISTSVINMFKDDRVGRDFHNQYWRHSLVTAFGSRVLMRETHTNDPGPSELAFSTGLLHDIGKMVMYIHSPSDAQSIMANALDGSTDELEAERELFGFDHALVGGVLTEQWNLPPELCRAIANHHQPLAIDDPLGLVDVIHVADGLAYHALATGEETLAAPPIDPGVFERSSLKLEHIGTYLDKLKKEYIKAETFMKMARGDS